jgi:hypothetical protein
LSDYSKFNEPARILFVFLALISIGAAVTFAVYRWLRITPDLRRDEIRVLTGKPKLWGLNFRGVGYYTGSYAITVDAQTFFLPSQARRLIDERKTYRFYLTPTVNIILAVEEISDP